MDNKEQKKAIVKEYLTHIYACGEWHKIVRGTFHISDSGPTVLESAGAGSYTWVIDDGKDMCRTRMYVRPEQIGAFRKYMEVDD